MNSQTEKPIAEARPVTHTSPVIPLAERQRLQQETDSPTAAQPVLRDWASI